MGFKLNTFVKIRSRVHCLSCKTPFPATPDSSSESLSARCPQCGSTVTIPSRDVPNEANARAGELHGPPNTAQTPGAGGARVWAGIISVTGLAVTFWAAFWPEPYRTAVLACVLMPLAAAVAVYTSGKQIKLIDSPRRSRTPNVSLAWWGPMGALLLRGLDFKVMDLHNAIVPVAVLTTALTLVIWKIARDPNDRAWKLLILVPFLAAYSYGALMEANGLFDSSRSVLYEVKVTGHRVVSGSRGGRTYYLKVAHWGSQVEDAEVSVSRRMYGQTKVNDTVHIGVRSGYFNIPWYYVRP
jgi:DNA-directed RNA polymerase subunit RPC12/RpoP